MTFRVLCVHEENLGSGKQWLSRPKDVEKFSEKTFHLFLLDLSVYVARIFCMFVCCSWEIGTIAGRVFPLCSFSNLCRLMTDPWEGYHAPELLALLRAPIKLEPISSPSSPGPFFNKPMSHLKSTAGRGRGRKQRDNHPRESPPRQNRGGHRASSVGARRPTQRPTPSIPSTLDSPPEVLLPHAKTQPGPCPTVEWHTCRASTLTARTVYKYSRTYGIPEETLSWVAPDQRANMPGEIYSAWSQYNIQAGATLSLHHYFRGVADYFDVCPSK